jgi:four helix bundle protein
MKKVRRFIMAANAIRSFRDLEVWHSAMQVAVMAHEIADGFPPEQRYALGAQIRRSSTSIPSNIAEGHAHRGMRSFLRHVHIALGSQAELDTQLEIGSRLNLIRRQQLDAIAAELKRCGEMLHGLQRALAMRVVGVTTMIGAAVAGAWLIRSAIA